MSRRAVIIVLDGVGIGAAPDAADYGDAGSDTLGNVARALGGLSLPNLERAGLGNVAPIDGVHPAPAPLAAHGLMVPRSAGKDSTTGHWEIAGVPVPFVAGSLALMMEDPDASSARPYVHWLAWNIDPALGALPEGLPFGCCVHDRRTVRSESLALLTIRFEPGPCGSA